MTAAAQEKKVMDFEADAVGAAPKGFELGLTGEGKPGVWVVIARDDAPSGKKVLAQTDADRTDYRFPVAFTGPAMKDLRLSVRCKPVSGSGDQACGLIFRVKDANNYYVARANALEDNVRLYHVTAGKRRQFGGWNGKVASGAPPSSFPSSAAAGPFLPPRGGLRSACAPPPPRCGPRRTRARPPDPIRAARAPLRREGPGSDRADRSGTRSPRA